MCVMTIMSYIPAWVPCREGLPVSFASGAALGMMTNSGGAIPILGKIPMVGTHLTRPEMTPILYGASGWLGAEFSPAMLTRLQRVPAKGLDIFCVMLYGILGAYTAVAVGRRTGITFLA